MCISTDASGAPATQRLAGYTQYDTAAVLAKEGWTESDYAVLAYGENFPDALAAAPLAYKYNAPILLSEVQSLPDVTGETLRSLGVKHVFIAGGTAVISAAVEDQLLGMGIQTTRLAGYDRYDTSVEIAEQLGGVREIFVVNGDDFSDALSVSASSALKNAPVILMPQGYLPESVREYLNARSIEKTYVVGDNRQISESAAGQLPNVVRITGADKYARNAAVLNQFADSFSYGTIFLATGNRFSDALAGSAYAAKLGAPILLLDSSYREETASWLIAKNSALVRLKILGGEVIMPPDLILAYTDALAGKTPGTVYTPAELAKALRPSVVNIEVWDAYGTPVLNGSGLVVDASGKVATSYLLLKDAHSAKVTTQNGSVYEVRNVSAYDTKQNVAVLKIAAAGLQAAVLGDSELVGIGDKIYIYGNYSGISETITDGMISTKAKILESVTYFQVTAAVADSDYGGVLLNEQAEVIGLTAPSVKGAAGLNLALPVNKLKTLFSQDLELTFDQLHNPGASDTRKKTDEEFAGYLNSQYGTMTIDGLSVRMAWKVNDYQSGSADISVHGMMESSDLNNWLDLIYKDKSGEMMLYFATISGEIKRNYPDTTFTGNVLFQDYYHTLPSKPYFPYNEVSYVSDGRWFVSHPVVTFYDMYPQGNSDMRVTVTDADY